VEKKGMQRIIQRAFEKSGLSVKKLSEITKLPYASAYNAVRGKSDPQLSTVERICNVLKLELTPRMKAKEE
jgi:predicted transcriptional regulator